MAHMVVSVSRGLQYRPQQILILMMGILKKVRLTLPYGRARTLCSCRMCWRVFSRF